MTKEPGTDQRRERIVAAFKAAVDTWLAEVSAEHGTMAEWMDTIRDTLLRHEREIQALKDRPNAADYAGAYGKLSATVGQCDPAGAPSTRDDRILGLSLRADAQDVLIREIKDRLDREHYGAGVERADMELALMRVDIQALKARVDHLPWGPHVAPTGQSPMAKCCSEMAKGVAAEDSALDKLEAVAAAVISGDPQTKAPVDTPKASHPGINLDAYTLRKNMTKLAEELAELLEDEANRYKNAGEKSLTLAHHMGMVVGTRRALAKLRRAMASNPEYDAEADEARTQNRVTRKDLRELVELFTAALGASSARLATGTLGALSEKWENGHSTALTYAIGEIRKRLESR